MNLVFLISSLDSGGAERVAATLCNSWATNGHKVTLIPTYSGGGTPFYTINENVELLYLSTHAKIAVSGNKRYLARLLALRRIIKSRQADVVISFLPNVNAASLVATAFSGIPCIVCERSDPTMQPLSPIWRLACNLLYRHADCVVVQTHKVADSIRQVYGGLRKVVVVPNPLPQGVFLWRNKATVTGRRQLLSIGRLAVEKRVDRIISAFSFLADRFLDWDLHIYGVGPLRAQLSMQIVDLGLQKRVLLLGSTNEPWRVMSEADAFVMASKHEGFPNALLEAMGVGLPCVVTDCPSGPSEITRNGVDALLVDNEDQRALQEALSTIMSDEQLRLKLGVRARESVNERYELNSVIQTWDALFLSIKDSA